MKFDITWRTSACTHEFWCQLLEAVQITKSETTFPFIFVRKWSQTFGPYCSVK